MLPTPGRAEVTVVRTRDDLRRTTRTVFGLKAARVARIGGPPAIVIGVLAFCVEQPVAGATSFAAAIGAGAHRWWRPEIAVQRFPAWAYRPVTFRVSPDGVEVQTEISSRSLAWADVHGVAVTEDAYFFGSSSKAMNGVILHHRTLTESDRSTID